MFQKLHNLRRKLTPRPSGPLSGKLSRRGQTAIILVFVIAMALIIYAASLNWGRVTQHKTLTIMGSNLAAANMASIIASYGEQQLQVNLGGRPKYCKRTNFLVMIVVIIIIIVITIVTWGATSFLLISAIALVALALAVAALVINLVIIQPGLTTLWNKMQDALLTMEDKVIENGLMTGLQSSVTDSVTVQDHFDMDLDGQWVDDLGRSNILRPADTISRFAYYYTMRMKLLEPLKIPEVDIFARELKELIYDNPFGKVGPYVVGPPASGCPAGDPTAIQCQDPDNFGLFDPGCSDGNPSPYCNPCCVPLVDVDGRSRPANCSTAVPVEATCLVGGAYPAPPYYFQYDPHYENYLNGFYSYRELLGVDDEHMEYNKVAATPNGLQVPDGTRIFYKKDSSGFYLPPNELRKGVYPFFWDMGAFPLANPIAFAPLTPPLPFLAGAPKPDNVSLVTFNPATGTNRFQTVENMCSLDRWESDPSVPKGFWWKPGMDHFCSTEYPYYDCGARSGGCTAGNFNGTVPTCGCTASGNPTQWREDPVDAFADGLKGFIGWANAILGSYDENKTQLYNTFSGWYEGAAYWVAPRCDPAWNCDSIAGVQPQCSSCNNQENDGYLIFWRNQLADWVDLLDKWLYGRSVTEPLPASFVDVNAWCLPPNQASVPFVESEFIVRSRSATPPQNRNGVDIPPTWGDLNDTIACLQFNRDNETKFNTCLADCVQSPPPASTVDNCLNLPRSVVPGFDRGFGDASVDNAYRTAQQYQDCMTSTCVDSLGVVVPQCAAFGATAATCAGWPANALYANLRAQRDAQFNASRVCNNDPLPFCGDGTLDAGEECDGTSLGGRTCASMGFSGGLVSCRGSCEIETNTCFTCGDAVCDSAKTETCTNCPADCGGCAGAPILPTVCGDDIIGPGEECDNANFGPETCLSQGFAGGGVLSCDPVTCQINTSACQDCGNNVIEPPEQCDNVALNGQTCTTQGFTGGALACLGTCAFDTTGCYACGNGICEGGGENCGNCPGDCGPCPPTPFQLNVEASREAARPQAADPVNGFQKRYTDLVSLRTKTQDARDIFYAGYDKFNQFLKPCPGFALGDPAGCAGGCVGGGPVAKLMCGRQEFITHTSRLPNYVIYGWRSPDNISLGLRPGLKTGRGYWHIVRVEAFSPKRCFKQCWIEEYPKVKTYTKWKFGFAGPDQFRCYELDKTDGLVIARVTRYDEDRDTPAARFANTQRIWSFRFSNPGVPPPALPTDDLQDRCRPPAVWLAGTSRASQDGLNQAFMLNENPGTLPVAKRMYSAECWDTANALLDTGVQTTTCARYYLDRSIDHMNLKFTPCPTGALQRVFTCGADPTGCGL